MAFTILVLFLLPLQAASASDQNSTTAIPDWEKAYLDGADEEALRLLRQMMKGNPGFFAKCTAGELLYRKGEYQDAFKINQWCCGASPKSTNCQFVATAYLTGRGVKRNEKRGQAMHERALKRTDPTDLYRYLWALTSGREWFRQPGTVSTAGT